MAKDRRSFNREVVDGLDKSLIKASIGVGAIAWKYTVLVPVEETQPGEPTQLIATDEDLETSTG
jgi:hypothetical protein